VLDNNFIAFQEQATTIDRQLQTVLPGGRNSGQKAQKGPQKKKVG
jgi:hypothetical protein